MNNGRKRPATKFNKKRTAGTFTSGDSGGNSRKKGGYGKPAAKTYSPTTLRLISREIKYDDDYMNLAEWVKMGQPIYSNINAAGFVNYVLGGVIKTGMSGVPMQLGNGGNPNYVNLGATIQVPNCLTNVNSGTTANTRIGNVIQPRYITIKGVVTASRTNFMDDPETTVNQSGLDTQVVTAQARFIRTSVKVFIIRDKSMNDKGFVEFNDVFAAPMQSAGGLAAPNQNPFLFNRKIDTIGRYEIVKEFEYQLDQDDPQKSFTHVIALKGKPIRYNGAVSTSMLGSANGPLWNPVGETTVGGSAGPQVMLSADAQSMTNGIYILAVSHSTVTAINNIDGFSSPQIVMSSRLTFED